VTDLIWVLEAVLLGCLLVYRWTDLRSLQPAWAAWLLLFGAGALGGIGVTSCLFFICGVLLGSPLAALVLELAAVAWLAYEAYRRRGPVAQPSVGIQPPVALPWIAGVLLLALGIATAAMAIAWDLNPHGNWDAWAIWNLRAKFLASPGGMAARAWSPILGSITHAEYPLLVSAFVGRAWALGHSVSIVVPAATSYVFFLALLALVAGGVTLLHGPTLGLLAALSLASAPPLLREVPAQYADVPLAAYIAGAILFALLDRPVLAGIFAGFAAWTKDEGLLFLILFLAATAVFRRRAALAAIAGALPAGALVIGFKVLLTRGNSSLLSVSLPGAGHRIFDMGRYGTVLAAFGREFIGMASGWYHPILPLAILAVAFGFARDRRRDMAFGYATLAALLVGYFGIYVITANDIAWQLQTSLSRLLMQVWPALILAGFAGLRAPEAAAIVTRIPGPKVRGKAKAESKRV
jgi:hypothetical protein